MGAPATVSSVFNPFTNSLGQVGFLGTAGPQQFIWVDNGIVWLDSNDTTNILSTGDTDAIGLSDAGGWVYGPHVNGDDSIYTNNGLLFLENGMAPGIANGIFRFLYLPRMLPNGDVWFVTSYNDSGGTSTDGRALYSVPGGTAANATVMLQTGDTVAAGVTLDTLQGIDDDQWNVASNGMHYITFTDLIPATNLNDGGIVVDGMLVARENESTGDGDNWDNFTVMAINDAGNYVFAGDTDNPNINIDRFIAYNGTIALRETTPANGIVFNGATDGITLNNLNQTAFIWDNGATESLMLACDAASMATTVGIVLAVNQEIDIDNNMTADHVITDFNTAILGGPGVALTENGVIYVEVELDGSNDAIIALEAACCGDGNPTPSEGCDDGGESMTCNDDCTVAACGDGKLNVTAGEDCDEGMETVTCDSDCTVPSCGDGVTNMTAGEDCDDGGESATCNDDCTPAECGDGKLNMTAGEQCEDGNVNDGDGCSANCQLEGQGGSGPGGMGGMGQGGMAATNSSAGVGGMGMGGMAAGGSGTGANNPDASGGCGCTTVSDRNSRYGSWLLIAGLLGLGLRRRRENG